MATHTVLTGTSLGASNQMTPKLTRQMAQALANTIAEHTAAAHITAAYAVPPTPSQARQIGALRARLVQCIITVPNEATRPILASEAVCLN